MRLSLSLSLLWSVLPSLSPSLRSRQRAVATGLLTLGLWTGQAWLQPKPASAAKESRRRPLVQVEGPRLYLGDLWPQAGSDAAVLDLGPSPRPGAVRTVTAKQIWRRIRQAKVKATGLRLPPRVRVKRASQVLSENQLARLLRARLEPLLPNGGALQRLSVRGGLELPLGRVRVRPADNTQLRSGRRSVVGHVLVNGEEQAELHATAWVRLPKPSRQPVVKRGAVVEVRAQVGLVTVLAPAVAQQDGVVGAVISVLPRNSRKTIQARVQDAKRVELVL